MSCLLKVKSKSYVLLKNNLFLSCIGFANEILNTKLSPVTGVTAGTRNNHHDIERKTKGRGRTSVHHHLPLLQHLTAQCFCTLPNSPVEKGRNLWSHEGREVQGLQMTQPRLPTHQCQKPQLSLRAYIDRRPCFRRKARKYLEKKDSIRNTSSHNSASIFLQECSYKHVACLPANFLM